MLYELSTPANLPITLQNAKEYLKIDTDVDDVLISRLLQMVASYAEAKTGLDYRANTWKLWLDDFEDRIELRRCPVASISTVEYTVSGSLTEIASSVWYLKKGPQWSEVLLQDGQAWPTDIDELEHGIVITFLTAAHKTLDNAVIGMLKHITHLYERRGDCDVVKVAEESGANGVYRGPGMSIVRV